MTWLLFNYSGHDDGFLCDFDNSVFLLCYLILLRYVSQLSQPPMYFFYVVLFYKDISQLPLLCYSILQRYFSTTSTAFYISQLPQPHSILQRYFSTTPSMLFYFTKIFLNHLNRRPPLHGLSYWHGLPCLAWSGLPCLAGTCLAWISVVMYFWNFCTVITCLSQTLTHVLPCWHSFVRKTRFAMLDTDMLVLYFWAILTVITYLFSGMGLWCIVSFINRCGVIFDWECERTICLRFYRKF